MQTETSILAHQYYHFEDLQHSSKEFYDSIEQNIAERQYPNLAMSRTNFHQGGMFSAKREYLCIRRKEYKFYICASPFGKSFFVSWWLKQEESAWALVMAQVPFIGRALSRRAQTKTFYQLDTEILFKDSIKQVVNSVVDSITQSKGLRTLAPQELKRLES